MHHCLQIQEVVGLVCSHLHPNPAGPLEDGHTARQPVLSDLAVLARTCTAFHSPALDLLWSSALLANLLRLLPSDLLAIDEIVDPREHIQYAMRLLRPIRVHDWQRILVYAPRVKHLFSSPDSAKLASIFPPISLCLPDNMLPNLRGLHWRHDDNEFHYIYLFITPNITSISSLLLDLSLALGLSYWDRDRTDDAQTISAFVRGLHHLETISVPALDEGALEHLCRLPNLRRLHTRALSPSLSAPPLLDSPPFPSLCTLDLEVEFESTTRLLKKCSGIPLAECHVISPVSATADESHALYTALAAGCSHSSLNKLTVHNNVDNVDVPNSAEYLVRPNSIRILFCFVNLTSVHILSPVGIDLDNEIIAEMARTWRGIEYLRLSSNHAPAALPRISLECLQSFARYCPRLRSLAITLHGTELPTPQSTSSSCPQNGLGYLDIMYSGISDPIAVARFLSGIFPCLMTVETARTFEDNEDPDEVTHHADAIQAHYRWEEVHSLLRHFAAILAEERNLAEKNPTCNGVPVSPTGSAPSV
ncbi:hypothetical protein DFH09DRAFT_1330695 [Mycena vulgaris]|nr:hypothetical protein DFH09DRAFT_1330695 [Mycena vulgaris]